VLLSNYRRREHTHVLLSNYWRREYTHVLLSNYWRREHTYVLLSNYWRREHTHVLLSNYWEKERNHARALVGPLQEGFHVTTPDRPRPAPCTPPSALKPQQPSRVHSFLSRAQEQCGV
jgi:hypothetical protein